MVWYYMLFFLFSITGALSYTNKNDIIRYGKQTTLLRDLVNRMKNSFSTSNSDPYLVDINDNNAVETFDDDDEPLDYEGMVNPNVPPSLRDREYLQHSTLFGKQYVSGGSGEGKQLLAPEGLFYNKQEIKSDAILPAYCDPPNPCPVGYTAKQGCLENFENTAAFSRMYQTQQECMCDTDHMLICSMGSADEGNRDNKLADNLGNNMQFMKESTKINDEKWLEHSNSITKKIHEDFTSEMYYKNPFLVGDKLSVAAKKGISVTA